MMTFILFFNEACLNNLASNVFLFFIFDLCLLRFYYFGPTLHFESYWLDIFQEQKAEMDVNIFL